MAIHKAELTAFQTHIFGFISLYVAQAAGSITGLGRICKGYHIGCLGNCSIVDTELYLTCGDAVHIDGLNVCASRAV